MHNAVRTIIITLSISGLFLVLNPPDIVKASSCSQQAAVPGGEEHMSVSSEGSCAISSAAHSNPSNAGVCSYRTIVMDHHVVVPQRVCRVRTLK